MNHSHILIGHNKCDTLPRGPEAIFLFGDPVKEGDVLLNPVRKSFEAHLRFIFKGSVEISVSELPDNDAAILGTAALVKA